MDNSFLYILDNRMKGIGKTFRKQARFNNSVVIFALSAVAYAAIMDMNNRELRDRIVKLNNEIKELKRKEGE